MVDWLVKESKTVIVTAWMIEIAVEVAEDGGAGHRRVISIGGIRLVKLRAAGSFFKNVLHFI